MEKYIKVEWWQAQKYQEEDWYNLECYEDLYNSVVFIPESIYNKYFNDSKFKIDEKVIYKTTYGDEYEGIVSEIDKNKPYPINVLFNNGEIEYFTLEGKYTRDGDIQLFKKDENIK